MPKLVIKATVIEVGSNWSDETSIILQYDNFETGDKQTMNVPCTKEDAKTFGKYLYQPVTVTVEVKGKAQRVEADVDAAMGLFKIVE